MTDSFDADPLEAVHATQLAVVDRVTRGGWRYDILYSFLVAALVAAPAAGVVFAIPVEIAVIAGLVALAAGWAKKNGLWISGIKPKKARWVAFLIGVIALAGYVANLLIIDLVAAPRWAVLFPAAVAFVAAIAGSRAWRAVYRREMGLDA